VLINIYRGEAIQKWQKNLNQNILKPTLKINAVSFADDQAIIGENKKIFIG
jgi:hypothetical protein